MVSKVRGHFTRFQGELTLATDPLASSVTATIELAWMRRRLRCRTRCISLNSLKMLP
jgi:polyisoprenoid-binding protein YceI